MVFVKNATVREEWILRHNSLDTTISGSKCLLSGKITLANKRKDGRRS